jgi:hypothetical protein
MTFDETIERLRQLGEELAWFRMHSMLGIEPAILPKRRTRKRPLKPREPQKTERIRANFNAKDIAFLERIIAAPSPIGALADYRAHNQRELPPKRAVSAPDSHCPEWRYRPARHLTAEDMIREQLAHDPKLMAKELRRLR